MSKALELMTPPTTATVFTIAGGTHTVLTRLFRFFCTSGGGTVHVSFGSQEVDHEPSSSGHKAHGSAVVQLLSLQRSAITIPWDDPSLVHFCATKRAAKFAGGAFFLSVLMATKSYTNAFTSVSDVQCLMARGTDFCTRLL